MTMNHDFDNPPPPKDPLCCHIARNELAAITGHLMQQLLDLRSHHFLTLDAALRLITEDLKSRIDEITQEEADEATWRQAQADNAQPF